MTTATTKKAREKEQDDQIAVQTGRWICLWPVYIDSKKTVQNGRRLPKDKCVSNPSVQEMGEVTKLLGVRYVVEPDKAYPRDFLLRGRLRVELKREDGSFSTEFTTRKKLLSFIASTIPKLPSRHGQPNQTTTETVQTTSTTTATTGKPPKRKKGGKKK